MKNVIIKFSVALSVIMLNSFLLFSQEADISKNKIELILSVGHIDRITAIEFSPDEETLLTASEDGTLKIWDVKTGKLLHNLNGHTHQITSASFSPDGKKIISTAEEQNAKLWDAKTGQLIFNLVGDSRRIEHACFSPDGKKVVTTHFPELIVWDVESGEKINGLKGHASSVYYATFSPDGKTIASASLDKNAILWDAESGKMIHTLSANSGFMHKVVFSPDGKTIITISNSVKLWDTETGKFIHTLSSHSDVRDAYYSFNGKYVLTHYYKHNLEISEVKTGKQTNNIMKYSWVVVPGTSSNIALLDDKIIDIESGNDILNFKKNTSRAAKGVFSKSEKYFAIGFENGGVYLYETETGKIIHKLIGDKRPKIIASKISSDNRYMATAFADSSIKLFDIQSGRLLYAIKAESYAHNILFDKENKTLIVSFGDGSVKAFDIATGVEKIQIQVTHNKINSIDVSPDGLSIVSTDITEFAKVWDLKTGKLKFILKGHSKKIISAVYNPNNTNILTSSIDNTAKLWDAKTGKLIKSFKNKLFLYGHYTNNRGEATYNEDGSKIICIKKKKINVYSSSTGKKNSQFKSLNEIKKGLFINKSDDVIGLSSSSFFVFKNGDEFYRKSTNAFLITGSDAIVSKNGKFLLTINNNKLLTLWDTDKYHEIFQMTTDNTIFSAVFSPDEKYFITTSNDASITYYSTKNGDQVLKKYFFFEGEVTLTQDGYFDGSPEAIKKLYYVNERKILPLENYFEQFYRPNLWQKVLDGEEIEKASIDFNNQTAIPNLEIIYPPKTDIIFRGDSKIDLTTEEQSFKLKLNISDDGGGVNEIRVYQNGKLVESDSVAVNEKGKKITKEYPITLVKGKNDIKVTAFNFERLEKTETCVVEYNGEEDEVITNLYVFTIGIDEYQKSTYNLNYAVADADALSNAIVAGSEGIFEKVEIVNLRNDEATKDGIIAAFKNIQSRIQQSDVFVFYYAGHGSMSVAKEKNNSLFYIVPYNVTNLYSEEMLMNKAISSLQLQEFSKNIAAQKQLFILDACQSGGAVEVLANRGAIEEKAMAILARSTGTYWLTASGSEQLASEFPTLGHGVFTYALLSGLSCKADSRGDNEISVKELSFYIENEVPVLSQKFKGRAQYPVSYGFGNDFPIVLCGKYNIDDEVKLNEEELDSNNYEKLSLEELEQLKSEAILKEDFEKAAELRDEIKRRQGNK